MTRTHDEAQTERANREELNVASPSLGDYRPTGWSDAGPVAGLLKDILTEQRKQTELLERLLERKEQAEAPAEYPRIP